MLSCKNLAHLASDYLDNNVDSNLTWKIRLHLLMCRNCRRFIKHLKITTHIAPKMINTEKTQADIEAVLVRIKQHKNL